MNLLVVFDYEVNVFHCREIAQSSEVDIGVVGREH